MELVCILWVTLRHVKCQRPPLIALLEMSSTATLPHLTPSPGKVSQKMSGASSMEIQKEEAFFKRGTYLRMGCVVECGMPMKKHPVTCSAFWISFL